MPIFLRLTLVFIIYSSPFVPKAEGSPFSKPIDAEQDKEKKQDIVRNEKYSDALSDDTKIASIVDDDFFAAEVISNPHDSHGMEMQIPDQQCHNPAHKLSCLGGNLPCVDKLDTLLDARHIVTKSRKEMTQKSSLRKITTSRILNQDVPIYHFQQPDRISPQQLPFSLMLISQLDRVPHREIFVANRKQREDSWFLKHYWSPIVVCACELACNDHNTTTNYPEADRFLHVGWKFTLIDHTIPDDNIEKPSSFFYALITQSPKHDQSNAEKIEMTGVKAPGWMMVLLKNGTAPVANI